MDPLAVRRTGFAPDYAGGVHTQSDGIEVGAAGTSVLTVTDRKPGARKSSCMSGAQGPE
jgi:hypothetical protein